jgi:WD40 repeat protein
MNARWTVTARAAAHVVAVVWALTGSAGAQGKVLPKPATKTAGTPPAAGRKIGGAVALVHHVESPLLECVVSANGATTVIYTKDTKLRFFRVADHMSGDEKKIGKNDNAFPYPIAGLHISPDGERVFGMINASTLAVVTKRPKILHHLRGNVGLTDLALHPNGERLVAGLRGGLVRIWDTTTGKPVKYLQAHAEDIHNLMFFPDGKYFVTSAADNSIRFFSFPDGLKIRELPVPQPPRQMCISSDGAFMVTLNGKSIQTWDLKLFSEDKRFDLPKASTRIAVSDGGKSIAVAHEDGSVSIHDITTGKRRFGWDAHPKHQIVCLRFVHVAGRSLLVTAGKHDDVVYWDVAKLAGSTKKRKKKRRRRN